MHGTHPHFVAQRAGDGVNNIHRVRMTYFSCSGESIALYFVLPCATSFRDSVVLRRYSGAEAGYESGPCMYHGCFCGIRCFMRWW